MHAPVIGLTEQTTQLPNLINQAVQSAIQLQTQQVVTIVTQQVTQNITWIQTRISSAAPVPLGRLGVQANSSTQQMRNLKNVLIHWIPHTQCRYGSTRESIRNSTPSKNKLVWIGTESRKIKRSELLSVIQWNCRGFRDQQKRAHLRLYLETKAAVAAFQEPGAQAKIMGYNISTRLIHLSVGTRVIQSSGSRSRH